MAKNLFPKPDPYLTESETKVHVAMLNGEPEAALRAVVATCKFIRQKNGGLPSKDMPRCFIEGHGHTTEFTMQVEEDAKSLLEIIGKTRSKQMREAIAKAYLLGIGFPEFLWIESGGWESEMAARRTIRKRQQTSIINGEKTAKLKAQQSKSLFRIEFEKRPRKWKKIAEAMTEHGYKMCARTASRYAENLGLVDNPNVVIK